MSARHGCTFVGPKKRNIASDVKRHYKESHGYKFLKSQLPQWRWVKPEWGLADADFGRQGWTSPWHSLSVPQLQRRLCFWTTFAQTYAEADPLTDAQMEEAVTAVIGRIMPLVNEWTLEKFLHLRPHRHLYRCRGGKSANEVKGEESRFALTAAQLESALWLLHKLMASDYEGADDTPSEQELERRSSQRWQLQLLNRTALTELSGHRPPRSVPGQYHKISDSLSRRGTRCKLTYGRTTSSKNPAL
ncbi:unnamed protein product [Parajaminaea phylloscopi]